MEKRIKTLYIVTICAILAFIGMQAYWLYNRYEYSLKEYEQDAEKILLSSFEDYKKERTYSNKPSSDDSIKNKDQIMANYNIDNIEEGGTIKRYATITIYDYNPWELLDIKDNKNRELTEEEKKLVAKLAYKDTTRVTKIIRSFVADNAPSEGAIWGAFRNMHDEYLNPFTSAEIDSMLRTTGLDASSSLLQVDSMPWKKTLAGHTSVISPEMTLYIPYSEIERKVVAIRCKIHPAEILEKMASSLIAVALLSVILILCLIGQISTIIKMSRIDRMRNDFVTTMVHELKRPISTLKMCVSGIENQKMTSQPEMKRELISETRTALDNLSSYFSKLRDITFNNVEQIPLNISRFNLHSLYAIIVNEFSVPATKSVEFINSIDSGLEIHADKSHMKNIIMNLVENAVKYSGESVTVTATAEKTPAGTGITISDDGNGIPGCDLKHIFSRFYRGKASSSELPGMGLGLAYVKLLVDAHGGTISVKSREGAGSSFTIIIPQ